MPAILRSAAHCAFRLLPQGMALPILSGPNRRHRWVIGAGLVKCWLGTYEKQEVGAFLALVGPQDVVWDIGAHAGYFTLACAARSRHVVACEASPVNAERLKRHLAINRVANVTVVERAICDDPDGSVTFGGGDSYQGSIGRGAITVRTTTIDALVAGGLPAPTLIKMDIEGAETAALRGARSTLAAARPTIMLALHGEERPACLGILTAAGYTIADLNHETVVARPVAAAVAA